VYLNQLNISFGIQLLAERLQFMVALATILAVVLLIAGRINRCIHHRDYVVSTGIVSFNCHNIYPWAGSFSCSSSGCSYAMGIISFCTMMN